MPSKRRIDYYEVKMRFIYIVEADNKGNPSKKFYGEKNVYYTGQTSNIERRMKEHIYGRNSRFLTRNFPDAAIIPRYIEYVVGTEADALARELTIKGFTRERKRRLFSAPTNSLVSFRCLEPKAIVLKTLQGDRQVAIYL